MDAKTLLRRAAVMALVYDRAPTERELTEVISARAKFYEELHLVDSGRLKLCGTTPAELVKIVLADISNLGKFCGCPSCRARSILN